MQADTEVLLLHPETDGFQNFFETVGPGNEVRETAPQFLSILDGSEEAAIQQRIENLRELGQVLRQAL